LPPTPPPLRRQPLNSVSTKIISFVFLSTFLTALVVSWISIQSTHGYLRRQIDERFPALLAHAVEGLDRRLEEAQRELGRRRGPDPEAWLAAEPDFAAAARLGPDGAPRASAGPAPLVAAAARAARDAGDAQLASVPMPDGGAVLVMLAPAPGGGRAAAVLDRASLERRLSLSAVASSGVLSLVDAQGRPLARAFRDGGSPVLRLPAHELVQREPGVVHEVTSPDGEHVLGSALPLAQPAGLTLVVEEPFQSAFEPVLEVVTRIFLSDLCIILVFSFLAYRIAARIMHPIEVLSEGARRISSGQIEHEIPEVRSGDEIALLTRTFNDMMRKLRRNQEEIESANERLTTQYEELLTANEILAQLSITDGLTKLHNHRYFQDHLTREIKRVSRTNDPLAILLMDLDDFKQFNDRMGHAAGDELLVRVARVMSESIRETDLLARYGGEEFVVLAPDTDLRGGMALAEKIRLAVCETRYILSDSLQPVRVTISVGVALYAGDRKRFFHEADRALYRAKADGKNCVAVAGRDPLRD